LSNRRGRTLLATVTAAHFSHHVTNSLLTPLLPLVRDAFALSYAESGLLVSAYGISLGGSNAPMGALADRVGSRPVIVVGLLLTGLLSLALATAGAYWQLLGLLVLLGLVAGSYHAPAAALLARAFPEQVRGAALGLHITGGHLSLFITPVVAGLLVAATGTWRTSYLWLAAAPLLTGVLVWRLTASFGTAAHTYGAERTGVIRALLEVARSVGPLVLLSILFQTLYAALLAFMALYLVDARGLPPPQAAAFVGAPQIIGVLGSPLGGYLSDRLGRRAVILSGMVLAGPAFLALTTFPEMLLPLALLAIGLASALRQTVTEVLVMDSAPAHRRATVMGGYYMLFQQLGGVAAPLLGVLAGLVGIGPTFTGITVILAISSAVVLLGHRKLI
ncbi:MAG: MFS transporter, partial [Chloroflexota bacterium]|nr:MFS transporter [Chloroflexota bacterium]